MIVNTWKKLYVLSSLLLCLLLPFTVCAQTPISNNMPADDSIAVEPVTPSTDNEKENENTVDASVPDFSTGSDSNNVNHWYQVEVLIFTNSSNPSSSETWPSNPALAYPENSVALNTGTTNGTATRTAYALLGVDQATLRNAERSLNNTGHRTLFHGVWQEPLPAAAQAPAILLGGGKQYGAHRELEGSITISVGRFIHVDTNLWLLRFAQQNETPPANPVVVPLSPAERTLGETITPTIVQVATMQEQRPMRSKTVHYIDNPHFGMLITFTPLD